MSSWYAEQWSTVADYLKMVRETVDDMKITAALVVALGKAQRYNEIEEFRKFYHSFG